MDNPTTPPAPETLGSQEVQAQRLQYEALESQLSSILQVLETALDLDPASSTVVTRMCHRLQSFQPPSLVNQPPEPSVRPKRLEERKLATRRRRKNRESVSSNSSSPSSSRTSSSSSLSPSGKPPPSGGSLGSSGMQDLLKCLDNRTVPRPEPYDVRNGLPLKHFLVSFEEYCGQSFRGSRDAWVGELGRLLKGEAAQAFQAYRSVNDSYDVVKQKLLRWYKEGDHKRKTASKKMFSKASIRPGEKVCFYAPRLQNLFELAYPFKSAQHSYTLLDKFLETIPRAYRKQIKSAQRAHRLAGRGKLKWSHILTLSAELEEEMTEPEMDPMDGKIHSFRAQGPSVGYVSQRPGQSLASRPDLAPRKGNHFSRVIHNQRLQREERQPQECSWCHLIGHRQAECRRWLGLCLACGAPDHFLPSCPSRRNAPSPPFSLPRDPKFVAPSSENTASQPVGNLLGAQGGTMCSQSFYPDKYHGQFRGSAASSSSKQPLNM